ncbi:hypothetical protein Drorol1_Dr00022175 [Drosera rotundifolia]
MRRCENGGTEPAAGARRVSDGESEGIETCDKIAFGVHIHELELLKEDTNVYKLIGPVLVKQDLVEANANVTKRIEYISAELYVSN